MRALISVSDKTGVVEFAKGLRALGWEVIATGGTMKLLADSGVEVINISDVTGFPEICDGRVKTLHPNVHGGLLARRDDPEHLKALKDNHIEFIDMVCVNLYPFRQTIEKPGVKMEDAIENIDIGGPSMLRSAAKNWADVTVVCDPADYAQILAEIGAGGNTEKATRLKLSAKAYTHTAEYDAMIATYMRAQAGLNEKLFLEFDLVQSLRYGENPHQSAKFYREEKEVSYSLAFAKQLNGKELSYNNIQDANAALCIVREFDEPFCVGLKHMNPCGAATGKDVVEAWTKAYEADKVSIFGGIVATNRTVTKEAAELMKPIFLEIIMAPKFDEGALEVLTTKKNLRLLEVNMEKGAVDPETVCERQRRSAGAGPRRGDEGRDGGYVRDEGEARPGADGGHELRLAHRQAREVERHRGGEGRPDAGRRRRADEPHRLGGDRPETGACRRRHRGSGAGIGRFLPLRRLRDAGRRIRRDGDRAARRIGPRRGFDPQGRRERHCDGIHR